MSESKQQLIAKIEAWAQAHNVPVSPELAELSEDVLTLLWVRLQLAEG